MKKCMTILSLALLFGLGQACSGSKAATSDTTSTTTSVTTTETEMATKGVSGEWALSIMGTPMGTVEAGMRVEKDGDDYKAFLTSPDGEVEIKEFEVDGNTMTGEFYNEQYAMTVDFKINYMPEKDELEGMMLSSFDVEGKRKM
ncbi:MAG: hypothetical protein AAGI23_17285 [Bacteroidota bacterium]